MRDRNAIDPDVPPSIGKHISAFREYHDLSQRELGEMCVSDHTVIGRIERNQQDPKSSQLLRLCRVLNKSPNEMLGWEE